MDDHQSDSDDLTEEPPHEVVVRKTRARAKGVNDSKAQLRKSKSIDAREKAEHIDMTTHAI